MTNYNGNAANVAGLTQVTVSNPQDGDSFTAANDVSRSNTLSDWMQRLANIALSIASTAWTWTAAQIFSAAATFNGSLTANGAVSLPAGAVIAQNSFSTLTAGSGAWTIGAQDYIRYRKDASGNVMIQFSLTTASGTNANTTMFQMPANFRLSAAGSSNDTFLGFLVDEGDQSVRQVFMDHSGNVYHNGPGNVANTTGVRGTFFYSSDS